MLSFRKKNSSFQLIKFSFLLILFFSIFFITMHMGLSLPAATSDKKKVHHFIHPGTNRSTQIVIDDRYEKKINPVYRKAMSAYNLRHYRINTSKLRKPRVIIVHATFVATLAESLAYFRPNLLNKMRMEISNGGSVNIGTHFIVDRRGRIYTVIPLEYCARHAVGLNYTAIGIENVALKNKDLTKAQLNSNNLLIAYLKSLYPDLPYLIGHHEYNDKKMPHYPLIKTIDKQYQPWDKIDPGNDFMRKLRFQLKQDKVYFMQKKK